MYPVPLLRMICFCVITWLVAWLVAPAVIGGDRPKQDPPVSSSAPRQAADDHVLQDLQRIRRQLGGSVLRGTLLEVPDLDGKFDADMKHSLGLQPSPSPPDSVGGLEEVIRTIRRQCARMDQIANEIEDRRIYRSADELRQSATQLRLLARRLDNRLPPKSISAAGSLSESVSP